MSILVQTLVYIQCLFLFLKIVTLWLCIKAYEEMFNNFPLMNFNSAICDITMPIFLNNVYSYYFKPFSPDITFKYINLKGDYLKAIYCYTFRDKYADSLKQCCFSVVKPVLPPPLIESHDWLKFNMETYSGLRTILHSYHILKQCRLLTP